MNGVDLQFKLIVNDDVSMTMSMTTSVVRFVVANLMCALLFRFVCVFTSDGPICAWTAVHLLLASWSAKSGDVVEAKNRVVPAIVVKSQSRVPCNAKQKDKKKCILNNYQMRFFRIAPSSLPFPSPVTMPFPDRMQLQKLKWKKWITSFLDELSPIEYFMLI